VVNSKLEGIKELVNKKKYDKALTLLRKLKLKPSVLNFIGLELELICLLGLQNYKLANVKGKLLINYVASTQDKISVLQNLAFIADNRLEPLQAIDYLKQLLGVDSSLNTAAQRFSLINFAYSIDDHQSVVEYGNLLTKVSEYSVQSLLLLAHSNIAIEKKDEALNNLNRIISMLRTEGSVIVEPQNIIFLFNALEKLQEFGRKQELVKFLAPRFAHEEWFAAIQAQLLIANTCDNTNLDPVKSDTIEESLVGDTSSIKGTCVKTVQVIQQLKSALESLGARFHAGLVIVEQDGNIQVQLKQDTTEDELLISLPLQAMPFVSDYRFTLDDNNLLQVKAKKDMLNSPAKPIMLLLVKLYNVCNKLSDWKANYPVFLLSGHQEIFDKLVAGRSTKQISKQYYADERAEIDNSIVIDSFFNSRIMIKDSTVLRQLGIKSRNTYERYFIPFIELINHKMGANNYQDDLKSATLNVFTGQSLAGGEIFVEYNLDDPLVTFLSYGFVDDSSSWVYSVPLKLKTTSGMVMFVSNYLASAELSVIPAQLSGLAKYFPASITRNGAEIAVSKLVIPAKEQPQLLKLVLSHILKSLDWEGIYTNPNNLHREIEYLNQQLIELNRQYWLSLSEMVQRHCLSNNPLPQLLTTQLTQLCDCYLAHLDMYEMQSGSLLKL
jgi:hypothetical protein